MSLAVTTVSPRDNVVLSHVIVVDFAAMVKEAKPDEVQAADLLNIPLWGRLLIKYLKWAVGILVAILLGFATQFYMLNRDIGTLTGKIEAVPAALAQKLLEQSKAAAERGDITDASRNLVLATSFLQDAKKSKAPVGAEFFDTTYVEMNQLKDQPQLSGQLHSARLELASYRSALQSPPKLMEPGKKTNKPISPDDLKDSTYLIFTAPGEMFTQTGPIRKISGGFGVQNIVLVGGVSGVTQTLDGIRWVDDVFENVLIRYEGEEVLLQNVKFVNCTFEIANNPSGTRVTDYAIIGKPDKLVIGQESASLSSDHISVANPAAIAGVTRKAE
jgi:hypothetical protein